MNKTGFQIKNNYFSAALYIELIVNNMKYRGIQCDFGRLTNLFFVTPDSLLFAVQRDTDFFQYTYCGRVFNPTQKGVLNKAGFAMHDPIAIGCMNAIMRECENPEHKTGHWSLVTGHWSLKPETCNLKPVTGNRSLVTGHWLFVTCNLKCVTPARLRQLGGCNQPPIAIGAETNENSTVFKIEKPSATETRFPAEGCISESRAIRACLMIRVFNN